MSAGGKGDKRIKESKTGNYAQGYAGINWGKPDTLPPAPLTCERCHEPTELCICQDTEDGPGQGSDEGEAA